MENYQTQAALKQTCLEVSTEGQPQVADIYPGCRMSLVPLRSSLRAQSRHIAKTKGQVVKMINKYLLIVLGVSLEVPPQVTEIYTGCRKSLAPLRSGLPRRGSFH